MKNLKKILLIITSIIFTAGCTNFSCILAPYPTPNVKKNKYYQKDFKYNGSKLSFNHPYGVIDTLTFGEYEKYKESWYLFYENGLVLKDTYYTDQIKDTLITYSENLKFEKCHGWDIGCFITKGDTLFWGTKAGYMKYWTYHTAIIRDNNLKIIKTEKGKTVDTSVINLPIQNWRITKKDIEL